MSKKILRLYNQCHLGDNLFCMVFFYSIKDYIEKNNIYIEYFCKIGFNDVNYHIQLNEFICSKNIIIYNINHLYSFNIPAICTWIGDSSKKCYVFNYKEQNILSFNDFLKTFFNNLLKECNIPIQMPIFQYEDPDLLYRYNHVIKDEYRNIDILIINSIPLTNQVNINLSIWNKHIQEINKKYNVVTTYKVEGVKCTRDENYTAKNIAAISTNIKILIGINSGVFVSLLNKYMLNNIKKAFIIGEFNNFNYHNFETKDKCITEISIEEIDNILQ